MAGRRSGAADTALKTWPGALRRGVTMSAHAAKHGIDASTLRRVLRDEGHPPMPKNWVRDTKGSK